MIPSALSEEAAAQASPTSVGSASPWVSVYVPLVGSIYGLECDALIRALVRPLIERCNRQGLASQSFFVRYSEGGPHVRVRILPRSLQHGVAVRQAILRAWDKRSNTPKDAAMTLRWRAYEPELSRYGGAAAMPASERLFGASSRLAFSLLGRAGSSDRTNRLGHALLATLCTLYVLLGSRSDIARFAGKYTRDYLSVATRDSKRRDTLTRVFGTHYERQVDSLRPYVTCAWEQLVTEASLSTPFDAFRSALSVYRSSVEDLFKRGPLSVHGRVFPDWTTVAPALAGSMVHMTNNRLGISIPEEAFLTFLLHRLLDDIGD